METQEDCIYFEKDKEENDHIICGRRGVYCKNTEDMCHNCRLWDSYIPKNSTASAIEYAQKWQNMGYEEQMKNDYYEYFKDRF